MTATSPDPFQGGGEIAKIMRSHNWSQTPLGAVEQWSVQLKTLLNLILNSCSPQFILWGKQLILLYNDAYASIWGHSPPFSTWGQPLNSCWPEMAEEICADIKQILATGEAFCQDHQKFNPTLFIQPQNPLKHRYFKTYYSPIFDQAGQIAGVLGTVIETHSQPPRPTKIHNILERITDAFVALDRNWRYTYVNSEAARLLGYSDEELIGKQLWKDVFIEDESDSIAQKLRQAMQNQTPLHLEAFSPIIRRELEINAYPSSEGISIYFRDISKRKKIEAQLRSSEEFNRRIIESSMDCITVLDLEGKLLLMNSGGQLLLEIKNLQPYLNQPWVNFWQDGDRSKAETALTHARVGKTSRFQGYCPSQSGQPKWWDVLITPIFGTQRQVEQILSLSRDITNLKQAEDVLRSRENLYRTLSDAVPDFIWSCDSQGKTDFVNSRWVEYTGLTLEEINKKNIQDINHPEDYPQLKKVWEEAQKQGKSFEAEFRYRRYDGVYRWFMGRAVPLKDEEGKVIKWIGTSTDIHERKQAEAEREQLLKQLEIERSRMRAILQQMPAGVLIADATSQTLVLVNQQVEQILGFTYPVELKLENYTKKVTFTGFHPNGQPYLDHEYPLGRSLTTGEVVIGEEIEILRADGRRIIIDVNSAPIRDQQGAIVAAVVVFRDITDQRQAERALRRGEERYRALIEQAPDAVFIADLDGTYIDVNNNACHLLGYSREELIGNCYTEIISLEDQPQLKALKQSLLTGNIHVQKWTLIRKDGTSVPVEMSTNILPDGRWQAFVRDITERQRTQDALSESEERFRQMAENIEDVFWIAEMQDYKILYVNPAYENIWGQPCESLYTNPYQWMEMIHPEDREIVETAFREQVLTGRCAVEFRIISADGSIRWIRDRCFPIPEENGQVCRVAAIAEDITERKQVEAALRRSEQQFRVAQELSLYAFTILKSVRDETGQIIDFEWVYVNPKAAEALKRPVEEILGQRLLQVLPGNQFNANLFNHYIQVVETGQPLNIEILYDADGITGWFHNMGVKLEDGVAVSFSNISDRKQAEVALRLSEARARTQAEELETLMEAVPAAIWIAHDPHCHQMSANLTAYELMKIPPGSVPTATPVDGINPLPFQQQIKGEPISLDDLPMQKAGRTGEEVEGDLEFIFDSGEIRYIYGKAVPLRDENGQVRGVIGAFLDITERKRAEEALQASEERFRLATRAVIGIIYDWDLRTNQVYRSEGLRQLIGIGPEEVPPDRDWWGERMHPEDRAVVQPQMLSSLANGLDRYSFEYRVRHQDGYWVDVWDRGYIIRDHKGVLLRVVGSTVDISDRKRAEAEREELLARERAAREEAEAANRIKDEFLAVLSHELRSPLNPILGWASLLQRQKVDDTVFHQALTTIERNVKLQVQLIDDLLDVSRILRGKLNLNRSWVDLRMVVISAVETVRLAAEAKSIEIQTHLHPEVGQVLGDAGRLQQIVWNLLSNAVKFSSVGGQVDIYLEQVGTEAQIRVQDQGRGISSRFLPHVFEYFRQEDGSTTRKFGGLGLGLAIVRYITEMHGGTVQAQSPGEGQGATFVVRLPLPSPKDDSSKQDSGLEDLCFDPQCLQGIRVLVAEDEADTRDFLCLMLEQAGATVIAVDSAIEALKAFMRSTPDILVSDIGMPEMDGYQLIKQVRSLYKNRSDQQMPAIALTAYAGEGDYLRAISAGFNQHLCKPVEPKRLITTILNLVQSSGC